VFATPSAQGWVSQGMPAEQLAKWNVAHARLNDEGRKAELGHWCIRGSNELLQVSAG